MFPRDFTNALAASAAASGVNESSAVIIVMVVGKLCKEKSIKAGSRR